MNMNAMDLGSDTSKNRGNGPMKTRPKPRISEDPEVEATNSSGMRNEMMINAAAKNASLIGASPRAGTL